jgi:hypothetical protein
MVFFNISGFFLRVLVATEHWQEQAGYSNTNAARAALNPELIRQFPNKGATLHGWYL